MPPSLDASARTRSIRLFGPAAIAAHAVVFTPLTGSILAAINHRRLGNAAACRRTWLVFALPSALLLLAEVAALERPWGGALRLAGFAWAISVARLLFLEHQALFEKHVAAGGQRAAWVPATLATVGVVIALLAALFASELLSQPEHGYGR